MRVCGAELYREPPKPAGGVSMETGRVRSDSFEVDHRQVQTLFSRDRHIIAEMLSRIVVGVKRLDVDRPVLGLVISLASETGGEVHVVHVRQQRCSKGGPSYDETMEDASRVVEQAVFELRMAGIGTNGKVTSTLEGRVARSIMEQADLFAADVIVVGCRKHHGLHRLFGNSDRDTLVRLSSVPVLLAPVESSQRPTDGAGELAGPRDLAP